MGLPMLPSYPDNDSSIRGAAIQSYFDFDSSMDVGFSMMPPRVMGPPDRSHDSDDEDSSSAYY
jgi:hypothetical protein